MRPRGLLKPSKESNWNQNIQVTKTWCTLPDSIEINKSSDPAKNRIYHHKLKIGITD